MPRPNRPRDPFWRAAAALLEPPPSWRLEQVRFELRRTFEADGGRWIASSLLACVERPARGGGPPALVANAHVHLWPPRGAAPVLGPDGPGWLRREAERFAACGWGVSWDRESGRFAWVARPLEGGLGSLVEERDFLERAFDGVPGESSTARISGGGASVGAALDLFRGGDWIPSALSLARRGVPSAAGTLELAILLIGPAPERRAPARPLRAEASVLLWPAAAGSGRDRALAERLRALGLRRRRASEGAACVRFDGRGSANGRALGALVARLDRAAGVVE